MTDPRYDRHNLIDWFSQEALMETRVAVIGAGAIGNEVIKNLALLGVGEIEIFDMDTIEVHNLTRSVLFRDTDIGQAKAAVAARRAIELDRNVTASHFHGDFWSQLALSEVAKFDVVFCCVDNFEARIRCNLLCYLAGVDFINTGIDSRSALIEVYPFARSRTIGCLECNLPATVYQRIAQRYSCGHLRKVSFIERKIPTTIITSAIVGSLAVSNGLRLGDTADEPSAQRIYVDTISGSLTKSGLARTEGCPCCGRFSVSPVILGGRPEIEGLQVGLDPETTVVTSEPLLVSYRVGGGDKEYIVFDRAARFDSSFPSSVAADPGAVELEVRDQFTIGELVQRFRGRSMPCKFATVFGKAGSVVFEFKGYGT